MLEPDSGVLALAVFGSMPTGDQDAWSDLDALLVVTETAQSRFFPDAGWLASLGDLYTSETHAGPWTSVLRICFTDMRRLDLVLTTEAALEQTARWPSVPFADAASRRVVFSRSPALDRALSQPLPPSVLRLPGPDEFQKMTDGFWFRGVLAAVKVIRIMSVAASSSSARPGKLWTVSPSRSARSTRWSLAATCRRPWPAC